MLFHFFHRTAIPNSSDKSSLLEHEVKHNKLNKKPANVNLENFKFINK